MSACSRWGRLTADLYTAEHRALVELLVARRRAVGCSQRTLARELGRSHSHVARIEIGQRRVGVLEFYRIAVVLGVDPSELFEELVRRWAHLRASSTAER